jgi:hypothetical protein
VQETGLGPLWLPYCPALRTMGLKSLRDFPAATSCPIFHEVETWAGNRKQREIGPGEI